FVDELLRSTLRATPMLTLTSYMADDTLAEDSPLEAALAERPEVTAVAPYLSGQALIARRASAGMGISARQGYTQILGIDPEKETRVLDLPVLGAQAEALARRNGIGLGASLASQLGVGVGDAVIVRDITGATARLEVAGTFRVGNELIDAVASYMSLANLQEYLGVEG